MDLAAKTIRPKGLEALTQNASPHVLHAIQKASAKTGVDFSYMVQQASAESSFNPTAKASGSSARGLYQFIESTWMDVVRDHGAENGIGDLASKIDANGKVADSATRQKILKLRDNPDISAKMAAEFAQDNKDFLQAHWGGEVGSTELYFAHFMGASGASAFLKAKDANPLQDAAALFPDAAKANRNVFYDTKTGRPRSLGEVYDVFDRKFTVKDLPKQATVVATAEPGQKDVQQLARSVVFNGGMTSGDMNQTLRGFDHQTPPALPYLALVNNPAQLMMLAQLDAPGKDQDHRNSF